MATRSATGRLYLLPTDPDLQLAYRSIDDSRLAPNETVPTRMFARLEPDGVTLAASLAVVLAYPRARELGSSSTSPPPPETMDIGGRATVVHRDSPTRSSVDLQAGDGTTFALVADNLSDAELAAAATSLQFTDPRTTIPVVPAGLLPVDTGSSPGPSGPRRALFQIWRKGSAPGAGTWITVRDSQAPSLVSLAWAATPDRAAPASVRGRRGILISGDGRQTLAWMEDPGTLVTVMGSGPDARTVTAVAEGLRRVDATEWTAVPLDVPGGGAPVRLASGEHGGMPWEATATATPELLGLMTTTCLNVTAVPPTCISGGPGGGLPAVSPPLGVRARPDGRARFLTAVLDRRATRVEVALGDGTTVEAAPVGDRAGFDAAFVVVELAPGAQPTVVTAFDADGRQVATFAVPPPP